MLFDLAPAMVMIYVIAGLFAGLIGGVLGLGGGIVIVPILHYFFLKHGFSAAVLMHLTITTSLATIMATSLATSYIHHRKKTIVWPIVFRFAPGILLGVILGATLAHSLPSTALQIMFGVFEMIAAIQIGFALRPDAKFALPNPATLRAGGVGIGAISAMLGIGGGTLIIPLLLWFNVSIRNAIAVASVCSFPIATVGTVTMIMVGFGDPDLPDKTFGYLYWPAALIMMIMITLSAPIGARLIYYLPVLVLKRLFAIILFLIGAQMLLKA